ncbi:MAG: hypothetical protein PWP46_1349 [Fusobacteriaceae bacterium]|jgi:SNF2 family DNA or RNA helicase|nr:SNF2-related protein [Fusobacteriales bacterium]MDN5304465.1 hypothetical protein [Fusobacteriaceae bacterium]
MFNNLKKHNTTTKNIVNKIFFKLCKDIEGYYISVVDENDNYLENIEHHNFNKNTQDILDIIESIETENLFSISWDNNDKKVYLNEHPFLLNLLKNSEFLIDENFNKLNFIDKTYELSLVIENNIQKNELVSTVYLNNNIKNFVLITENCALFDNNLVFIKDIGENFENIQDLNSTFIYEEFERFLTITYSYFNNITIKYKNYSIENGPVIVAKPLIIIEKIDKAKSLYLKLGTFIPNFDNNFIEEYNIKNIITINELEQKILIHDIKFFNLSEEIEYLLKIIITYQRELKLKNGYFFDENLIILEEKLAREFISKELTNLLTKYQIIGTDKFKKYNIKNVKPKLITNLSHSIDFLEGDVSIQIEDETFSIFDLLSIYKKNSYITLSDGTNALINKSYIEKLERIFRKDKSKAKISFFDLPIIQDLIDEKLLSNTFPKIKEIFEGFNNISSLKIEKPKINATLRSYQEYGYKWLVFLYNNNLNGCLADDMGLGKTIQTISLLSYIYPKSKKPTLIVMPKSLIYNWENEILKFNPNLYTKIYYGINRDLDNVLDAQIILTTYGTVRNDIKLLQNIDFEMIVLDESQNIKNVNSQITKAVTLLNAKHKLALSGTPVENNLGELYSLFRFLNPNMFGSAEHFNNYYLLPIQRDNDKEVIKELKQKIYPFILRRTKKEVLKELPEKIEQTLFIEMNPKQKKFYEEQRDFYYTLIKEQIDTKGFTKSKFFILQALNELRQIASVPENISNNSIKSSKREVLIENIKEAVSNNHKILIFSNFIKTIENICEDLEKENIKHLSMTGSTKNRQQLVDEFQNNNDIKVFVMTLKTGGVGLNLTSADTIFIFDPWWNKTAEDQAIDRSHRMGQKNTVFSYKLISKGTIEEKILQLQYEKSKLFESLISDDSNSIKTLSKDDIDFILNN